MPCAKKSPLPKAVILCGAVLAALVAVLVWLWSSYGYRARQYTCTNVAMGAYVQQTVYGGGAEEAAAQAARAVGDLEERISWRIEGSDIQRLNADAGSVWTEVEEETASLLALCLEVAERSGGAFDPTVLPLSALWDFGGENQHVPTPEQIETFLQEIDYRDLRVDTGESSASLKYHGMGVDLGAVGKGAACDAAVAAYEEAGGVEAAILSVGGSVGTYRQKPDGSPWSVAVRDPGSGDDKNAALGVLEMDAGFVSTSGSYEKAFTEGGVTYHHLLDPKTGYPAESGLVSVTVWCESGALSDALSTACFVLGLEDGAALLEEYGAGGVWVDAEGGVTVTGRAVGAFTPTADGYTLEERP